MPDNRTIWQIAIPAPLRSTFDYFACQDTPPLPGARVKVPFGRREMVGFFLRVQNNLSINPEKMKTALAVLDKAPILNTVQLALCEWASQYYQHPLGEVCLTGLPAAIRQGKPLPEPSSAAEINIHPFEFALTCEQEKAIHRIGEHLEDFAAFCLQGVTGSGKTEVYCQIIEKCLDQGKQALLLVPEIALTPQTLKRFTHRFGQTVLAYHSTLTDKKRLLAWSSAAQGEHRVIVGTRSAIFLPFQSLGAIIIDEEHDGAFKQQEGFRYHARDVAMVRGKLESCPVILGSATPSFETLRNIQLGKYTLLKLNERVGSGELPSIEILDIRHKKLDGGLSSQALSAIRQHLEKKHQVLIFLNRRGFSPCWMCFDCGWLAKCHRCDSLLTFHKVFNRLWCHHCNRQLPAPDACPECETGHLQPVGTGCERLETTIESAFPDARLLRIDSDSTRKKGALEEKLTQAANHEADILIGTQLLTKGHHFSGIKCVVVVDADGGLFSHDFKAIERLGQMITQVAGRAGRESAGAQVLVQSFHPKHPLLNLLLREGYEAFAQNLLTEREQAQLPPFGFMALLRADANQLTLAMDFLSSIISTSATTVQQMGPIPASMPKKAGRFRAQTMLLSPSRSALHHVLTQCIHNAQTSALSKKVRWSVDVDPIDTY